MLPRLRLCIRQIARRLELVTMVQDFAQWLVVFVLNELSSISHFGKQITKAGNHEDANQSSGQHPTDCGGTDRAISIRSGAS